MHNKGVLIVEDEPAFRETLKEVLGDEGYSVAEAANGREGLDWLRANPPPCVVLLDLTMPVMDGAEMLSAVRKDGALKNLKVVVVSAAAPDKLAQAVKKTGANGYLPKPFEIDELLGTIARYC